MYCARCGTQNDDNGEFCKMCGHPLKYEQSFQSGNGSSSSPKGGDFAPVYDREIGETSQSRGYENAESPQGRSHGARTVLLSCLVVLILGGAILSTIFGYRYWKKQGNSAMEGMASNDYATFETENTSSLTGDNSLTDSDAETLANYEEVDDLLTNLVISEEYSNLETEEKAEKVLDILNRLEDEQRVAVGSVKYDETTQLISYQYADGSYGGVMLEDFTDGTSGIGEDSYETDISYNEEENVWKIITYASIPSFNTENYPYVEENLTALIVCNFGNGYEDAVTLTQLSEGAWTDVYLQTTLETNDTIKFYRSGLIGYDLIVLQEHGIIYEEKTSVVLQESTFWKAYLEGLAYTYDGALFLEDFQENRVAMICLTDGNFHTCLLPSFFTYYYEDDGLEDSIVWLGCCNGYRNDYLVEAIADCGAKAVLAATETVNINYDLLMMDAFVYMLLYGNNVDESLAFAQAVWGKNDAAFLSTYLYMEDDTPAEVRYFNGGDETLATLTDDTKAALTGSIDAITFERLYDKNAYEYAVITAYDENGNVVWEYITSYYEQADLYRVGAIGWRGDFYYFVENGSVIALSSLTGEKQWENADFGGGYTGSAFGEDAIYLCGYYGPDFYAVSYEGETLYRIEQFDENYYWASKVELKEEENLAVVYMCGGAYSWDDPLAAYVDLETGEYYIENNTVIPADAMEWNGHYYYIFDNMCSTWEEAEEYCRSLGGYMAVISSALENSMIYEYMKECGYNNAYFGFSDHENEGTWVWETEEASDYANWSSGEPNSENSKEDYAMFYYRSPAGEWNDGDFESIRTFICEWAP